MMPACAGPQASDASSNTPSTTFTPASSRGWGAHARCRSRGRARPTPGLSERVSAAMSLGSRLRSGCTEVHREGAAGAELARHLEAGAHSVGDLANQREAQAEPAGGARRGAVALAERLEQRLQVALRDAGAVVLDLHRDAVAVAVHAPARAQADAAAGRRELHRVVHEHVEDALEPLGVTLDAWQLVLHLEHELPQTLDDSRPPHLRVR